MGILDKIEDKLSGNKHNTNDPTVHNTQQPHGTHTGQGSHLQHGTTSNTTGSGVVGGPTTGSTIGNTHGGPGAGVGGPGRVQDAVPGSHPAAHNPAAIPTAGGERVGNVSGGNAPYDSTHDNRTIMEKAKDKLSSSRTDRPDDPVTGTNFNQSTPASHGTTDHSGVTGAHSANTPLAHDSDFNQRHAPGSGVTGTGAGLSGPGHTGSGPTSSTHTGPGVTSSTHAGPGMTTSTHTGPGMTTSTHTGPGMTSSTHTGSGLTGSTHTGPGSTTHGSSNIHDNRTMTEKAKDKLSSSRTDRPDDPVTGQNYGQSGGNYGPGTTGGVTGSHHTPGQTSYAPGTAGGLTGSHNTPGTTGGLAGSHNTPGTHAAGGLPVGSHNAPGTHTTGGLTGSHKTPGTHTGGGLTGNNHSSGPMGSSTHHTGTAPGVPDNRSTMEKIKDKVMPSKTDRPDDPITGQNVGQTGGHNTTHTTGSGAPGGVAGERNW